MNFGKRLKTPRRRRTTTTTTRRRRRRRMPVAREADDTHRASKNAVTVSRITKGREN